MTEKQRIREEKEIFAHTRIEILKVRDLFFKSLNDRIDNNIDKLVNDTFGKCQEALVFEKTGYFEDEWFPEKDDLIKNMPIFASETIADMIAVRHINMFSCLKDNQLLMNYVNECNRIDKEIEEDHYKEQKCQ